MVHTGTVITAPLTKADSHLPLPASAANATVDKSRQDSATFSRILNHKHKEVRRMPDRLPAENSILKMAANYFDRWSQNEKKAESMKSALNPQLRDLFNLQKSVNRLSLHTQAIERIAEAFASSLKSLQKAAGG